MAPLAIARCLALAGLSLAAGCGDRPSVLPEEPQTSAPALAPASTEPVGAVLGDLRREAPLALPEHRPGLSVRVVPRVVPAGAAHEVIPTGTTTDWLGVERTLTIVQPAPESVRIQLERGTAFAGTQLVLVLTQAAGGATSAEAAVEYGDEWSRCSWAETWGTVTVERFPPEPGATWRCAVDLNGLCGGVPMCLHAVVERGF